MNLEVVNINVAKMLKALGFNWKVDAYYCVVKGSGLLIPLSFDQGRMDINNDSDFEHAASAPEIAFASKWLRDVKKVYVRMKVNTVADGGHPDGTPTGRWTGTVWLDHSVYVFAAPTHEQAELGVMEKTLQHLIKKEEKKDDKGEFGGTCNLSRCTTGYAATWYNYGTRKYYCRSCAAELNNDEYNKRDALRLFGHELCIEGEVETH